jgi:DNA-binding MarR family transcriptional regulator
MAGDTLTHLDRDTLIEEFLGLEGRLMQERCAVQPPAMLDIDVTMLQLKTLLILSSAARGADPNGLRVSDLARWLTVSAATTSTLIDRLVDRGLVERREDPLDRRQHRCRASTAGQELVHRFYEGTQAQSRELLEVLSDDELHKLLEGIKILIGAVERVRGGPVASH